MLDNEEMKEETQLCIITQFQPMCGWLYSIVLGPRVSKISWQKACGEAILHSP